MTEISSDVLSFFSWNLFTASSSFATEFKVNKNEQNTKTPNYIDYWFRPTHFKGE